MSTRRKFLIGLGGAVAGVTASLPIRPASITRPGTAFGTTIRLTVTASSQDQAERAIDAGYAQIRSVHKAASLFETGSEISRLNVSGQLKSPSPEFEHLFDAADRLYQLTNGAFDASVQPLWNLWAHTGIPSPQAIAQELNKVGWSKVRRESEHIILKKGSSLTFNGIAQGYAADCVMSALKQEGVLSAAIDTGEAGRHNSDGRIAIRHPRKEITLGWIELREGFAAASGDYATAFTPNFLNHHIFDPHVGRSPLDLASVVVVAPSGIMADGLATAFMVMGTRSSLACLSGLTGCHAAFVDKQGRLTFSPGMRKIFYGV